MEGGPCLWRVPVCGGVQVLGYGHVGGLVRSGVGGFRSVRYVGGGEVCVRYMGGFRQVCVRYALLQMYDRT